MEDKEIQNNSENLSDNELLSDLNNDFTSTNEDIDIIEESEIIETQETENKISELNEKEVIENDINLNKTPAQELITVRPVKFQEFEKEEIIPSIKKNLDIMQDVTMHISVEIGKTKSSIREVMELKKGSIVELNKVAGEPVEIYVNEKLVAKGEVIVMEDKFGVRVTTTNLPKDPEDDY